MLINQLDCILFDADETLFVFDAYQGLRQLFAEYSIEFSADDYQAYQVLNKSLWATYQQHQITAEQLKVRRFESWAQKVGVTASQLNQQFLHVMADICQPLPGAQDLLASVAPYVSLGIITNGFTDLLHARLQRTGFDHYFKVLTISEQFGLAKPAVEIFQHTLQQLPGVTPERCLMVGDTPESDIAGGIQAGMKTCWLDHGEKHLPEGITPNWQVTSLLQLQQLLIAG